MNIINYFPIFVLKLSSEQLFKTAADIIASEGYKDVGYEYVIIDDCWLEPERDNITKELVPDRKRFPNGMKALADYVCIAKFLFIPKNL